MFRVEKYASRDGLRRLFWVFGFRRAKTDRDRDLGRVFDSPRGEDYRDACPKSDFPVKNSAPDVGAEK